MYNNHKMYKGGSIYSEQTEKIFKYAGLFLPTAMIAYGALAQFGFLNIAQYVDGYGFAMLAFCWIVISIINYVFPPESKLDSALRLGAYHLLTGTFLIFVAGVSTPFSTIWLLLMIGSYMYFSKLGLQLSALSFSMVVAIDILLWGNSRPEIITYDNVTLVIILITMFTISAITKTQEIAKDALRVSQEEENLQRERLETIINNMTDGVISTDADGVINLFNAASLNLLDTNINLQGKHIDEILPLFDNVDTSVSIYNEIKNANSVIKRDDLNFKFSEDDSIRLEITYSPIHGDNTKTTDKNQSGYIIIMRDVTKAKSLEEERDEFISVVSHELRTPLTIAEGTISNVLLMVNHPDTTEAMLKDSITVAHDQVIFLANMVNDLSTLSRAERGVANTAEDIDVRQLAHTLHEKYQEEAANKKLHLDLDLGTKLGMVHVSRLYLEEILQNFITNSIKYTKEGSVKIIIKREKDNIHFAVKDTGIGISKSDQTKIFNKFYRSEDYRTRETSGTGLGLYVAAKLARNLGIKIQVVSRLNFGSTFSFELPRVK
jgi:two-component system phosphate regulon sensor histidine kinase PhoR